MSYVLEPGEVLLLETVYLEERRDSFTFHGILPKEYNRKHSVVRTDNPDMTRTTLQSS